MDKKITQIIGGLLLCFMFFGSYLNAMTQAEMGRRGSVKVARRSGGGRGRGRGYRGYRGPRRYHRYHRYHRPYWHRRHRWYRHGWGWWGWPTLWFTIAATQSDRSKQDPLKDERDRANNAIANYENMLDTLGTAVDLLKQNISYYTPPASIQMKYYETDRLVNDYAHQISILDLKLDLLTNRIGTASANKSTQKALNDVVVTAQRHQAEMAVLKAEVDLLTRDVSSLNMKQEAFAKQILDRMKPAIQYHTNQIKKFKSDIKRLTERL